MNKSVFLIALFFSLSLHAAEQHQHTSRHGVHGMILFGAKGEYYISHLPLFHHPHDMQLIAQVNFPKENHREIDALLQKASLVTLVPEVFDLNQMDQKSFTFQGDLYNGHFERGGSRTIKSLPVTVESIIEKKHLEDKKPQLKVSYRLIPNNQLTPVHFYYRIIDGRPAADHIFSVQSNQSLPEKLSFSTDKLFVKQTLIAEHLKTHASLADQIYLEVDELQ